MADGSNDDGRALRRAFGMFATGVTVVTTRDGAGRPVGLTANSFTSVSLDPPLLMVCVGHKSAGYASFVAAPHFAVSILRADQAPVAHVFATRGADKFAAAPWVEQRTGVPVIEGASAWFDCAMDQVVQAGDHAILIGRILAFDRTPEAAPLCWYAGRFAHIEADPRPHAGARAPQGTGQTGAQQGAGQAGAPAGVGLAAVVRRGDAVLVRAGPGGPALPRAAAWGPADDPASLLGQLAGAGVTDAPAAFWSSEEGGAHLVFHGLEAADAPTPPAPWAFARAASVALASRAEAAAVARLFGAG